MSDSQHDAVNHPSHYTSHPSGVECITVTEHMGFNVGNAVKYLWRADEKGNALEDLHKARWYVDREIQRREHQLAQAPQRYATGVQPQGPTPPWRLADTSLITLHTPSLYARIDAVDRSDNAALTGAFLAWLDDRLGKSDMKGELDRVLQDSPTTAAVIAAVLTVVRQP